MCLSGGRSWLHGARSYSPEIRDSSRISEERCARERMTWRGHEVTQNERGGERREEDQKKEREKLKQCEVFLKSH